MGFSKDLLDGLVAGDESEDAPPGSPESYRERKLKAAEEFGQDRRGPVQKQEVERRGRLSSQIQEGIQGTDAVPKPYDPALLLDLGQNPVVQTYIDTLSQDAASANWKLVPEDEAADVTDDELAQAERRFRQLPAEGTARDLYETTARGVLSAADMPVLLNFEGGYDENVPTEANDLAEVVPTDPTTMFKTVDDHGFTDGFVQVTGSSYEQDVTPFERAEVAWFSWGNRVGHVYGMSPVEKGQDTIEVLEEVAEKEILDLIQGMPPGIISRPDEADMPIDENDWSNFKDDMRLTEGERHRLGYAKFPVDYTPLSPNYQELQLLDRYKLKVTELGGVFKVNPSYAGFDFENANRATDESQQVAYKQRGFQVLLRILETGFTENVVKPFIHSDLRLEFEKETTPEERKQHAESVETTIRAGKEAANAGLSVSYRDGRLEIDDGEIEEGNVGSGGDEGGGLFGSLDAPAQEAARKATGVVLGSPGGRAHTGDFQVWTKFLDRFADMGGEIVDLRGDGTYPENEISPEDALIEVRGLSEQEVLSTVHSFDDITLRQVEDVDVGGTGQGNGNSGSGASTDAQADSYPAFSKSEWKEVDDALYGAFENQIMPESAPGVEKEVWTNAGELPEYVREKVSDAIDAGAVFDKFESVPERVAEQVEDLIEDSLLDPEGWSLGEVADGLQESFDALSEGQAETVARTETASVLNEAREQGYEERPDSASQKFMWVGPDDSRTTDACQRLKELTNPDYGGTPVALPELIRLEEQVHNEEFPDLEFRKHTVHINERHTFRRALPNELDAEQNISASVKKNLPEEVFEDISESRFVPPDGAAEEARQALAWIDEHGRDEADGATEEGLARARQIIEYVENGDPLTSTNDEGTPFVVEIANFFNRHRENRDLSEEFEGEPWKDNGYLSWLLWGGDPGDEWANALKDRLDEEGYL
jgi:hypothetical protein